MSFSSMKFSRVLPSLFAIALLSSASNAMVMQHDLSFSVSTDTPNVAIGEDVVIDLNITNNSANDISFGFTGDISLSFWNIQSSDINGVDCFVSGLCDDVSSNFDAFMDFHWGTEPRTVLAGTTKAINFWNLRFTNLLQAPGILEIGQTELKFGDFFNPTELNYLTNGLTVQIGPLVDVSAPAVFTLFGVFGLLIASRRRNAAVSLAR